MSRATGIVRFESDGSFAYFLYNGTVDVCWTRLVGTIGEAWGTEGRSYYNAPPNEQGHADRFRCCACGQPPEKVEIATDYGYGFHWPGTACRYCCALLDGHNPDAPVPGQDPPTTPFASYHPTCYIDLQDRGLPEWWEEAVKQSREKEESAEAP